MSADAPARGAGCVALIGMPGSGKSTVGALLAGLLGLDFVDTDLLIERGAGRRLQQILDDAGWQEVRRLEEEAILALDVRDAVIATGGSAVYSERAMARLHELGAVVHLAATRATLEARVTDYDRRGVANPAGQGLEQIARERAPLYARHADRTVAVDGLTPAQAARAVAAALRAGR